MSVSLDPLSMVDAERANWFAPAPVSSSVIGAGMFFADTWSFTASVVLPTTPATRSTVAGVTSNEGTPCEAVATSSAPRGAMMSCVAEAKVRMPVSSTSSAGMVLPMSVVPLNMRTLASLVPSVTTGCFMPSAKVAFSATSLNFSPFTLTTFAT